MGGQILKTFNWMTRARTARCRLFAVPGSQILKANIHSFDFVGVFFFAFLGGEEVTPKDAQGLLLALPSEIFPGRIRDARN